MIYVAEGISFNITLVSFGRKLMNYTDLYGLLYKCSSFGYDPILFWYDPISSNTSNIAIYDSLTTIPSNDLAIASPYM